jgi:hypothetical protein
MNAALRIGALAMLVECAWAQGSAQELASAAVQRWSKEQPDRTKGLSNVIRTDGQRAVLLLSGVPLTGNSGDDTILGIGFSGVYEAQAEGGRWTLGRRIPLEELGQILAHRLKVSVRPGRGVDVEDRMRIRVKGNDGFAARLNHKSILQPVKTGAGETRHHFGGGLLWVDIPPGETELALSYSLEVENDPKGANSGCFWQKAGHIRNQYFWHPYFDFGNPGDQAEFQVEAHIPMEYGLTTSLPQAERVEGEERIVQGKTVQPTMALTLAYDREWKILNENVDGVRLELLVTPDMRPEAAAIQQEFRRVNSLLAGRFGPLKSKYFAVVQARADEGNNWHFSSNQAVFAAGSPGLLTLNNEKVPAAPFSHEVSHQWTQGAGPAANLLREGWATYVESLMLEHEFGPDTARSFWSWHALAYFMQYDGKANLLEDENNAGIAYFKGPWLFRMLEEAVGSEAFQKAMADFSRRSLAGAATWEVLAECFQEQKAADFDARAFLLPWLKEKSAPHLTAQVDGRNVTIRQSEPYFILPVTVEATTPQGAERHRVWVRSSETAVRFAGDASSVRVDPDQLLLLRP